MKAGRQYFTDCLHKGPFLRRRSVKVLPRRHAAQAPQRTERVMQAKKEPQKERRSFFTAACIDRRKKLTGDPPSRRKEAFPSHAEGVPDPRRTGICPSAVRDRPERIRGPGHSIRAQRLHPFSLGAPERFPGRCGWPGIPSGHRC